MSESLEITNMKESTEDKRQVRQVESEDTEVHTNVTVAFSSQIEDDLMSLGVTSQEDEEVLKYWSSPKRDFNNEKETCEKGEENEKIVSNHKPTKLPQSVPSKPENSSRSRRNIRNRLSSWGSNVIQNSEVLKAAQKNLKEKGLDVQKVVKNNFGITPTWSNENKHDRKRVGKNRGRSGSSENETSINVNKEDATRPKEDEQSCFSFDSDEESHGTSVFVGKDDALSVCSDQSSVHVTIPLKRNVVRPSTPYQRSSPNPTKATIESEVETSSYRGRYTFNLNLSSDSKNGLPPTRIPTPPPRRNPPKHTESQEMLIRKSSASSQMESIISSLNEGEYVMLLNKGMLGVNLKQTFTEKSGVYVDHIVPGGNVGKSKVVFIGDTLLSVGETCVRRGTIWDVPEVIMKAKRPTILTFSALCKENWETMDNVATAVGMINRIREETRRGISSLPIGSGRHIPNYPNEIFCSGNVSTIVRNESSSLLNEKVNLVTAFSDDVDAVVTKPKIKTIGVANANCSRQNVHAINPSLPSKKLRHSVAAYAARRNNQMLPFSTIMAAAQHDNQFSEVLREAFVTCCIDCRRLPFFAAFISNEDSFMASNTNNRLMLYLELISFRDLYDVIPQERRNDHAKRIANKFLMPIHHQSNNSEHPTDGSQFDMRSLFTTEALSLVEKAMNGAKKEPILQNVFLEFEMCLKESLATTTISSFMLSDECARMRAYMRRTSPYIDPSLSHIFREVANHESQNSACNHVIFIMIYLLCQLENDVLDKNFDKKKEPSRKRVRGSSSGISCAIFIRRTLVKSITETKEILLMAEKSSGTEKVSLDDKSMNSTFGKMIYAFEHFWEVFIAPSGGALDTLSHYNECQTTLDAVRRTLLIAVSPPNELSKDERGHRIVRSLALDDGFLQLLLRLSSELIYEYAHSTHTKYRGHVLHEWMCVEANKVICDFANRRDSASMCDERIVAKAIPDLPVGCISRLMRRVELPEGISRHQPRRLISGKSEEKGTKDDRIVSQNFEDIRVIPNADFAIIFGTDYSSNDTGHKNNSALSLQKGTDTHRFVCVSLKEEVEQKSNRSNADIIPPNLESYAFVPSNGKHTFSDSMENTYITQDGWEASLINFMIPGASTDNSPDTLYGVSLVLHNRPDIDQEEIEDYSIELVGGKEWNGKWTQKENGNESKSTFSSVSSSKSNNDKSFKIEVRVDKTEEKFNHRLSESKFSRIPRSQKAGDKETSVFSVGIVLVAKQNVIPAMRETLGRLFEDFAGTITTGKSQLFGAPLIDILGNFRHPDIEHSVLNSILDPFIKLDGSLWRNKSLRDQTNAFNASALEALVESIPPIPLALLFISALLEQKIVFSSKRRSILLSVSIALRSLLEPLEWPHLFVPLVPLSVANDLVQYPAPYILGIPLDEKGSMHLLKSLPDDVTLVDVDVGRVVLAKNVSNNCEVLKASNEIKTPAVKLRLQVLRLAENLGSIIGTHQCEQVWCCDSPLGFNTFSSSLHWGTGNRQRKVDAVQNITHEFVKELLSGSNTCCFWIEDETENTLPDCSAATILFDEDRFLELKTLRADGCYLPLLLGELYFPSNKPHAVQQSMTLDSKSDLALPEGEFNLFFKTFLRDRKSVV